jgi:hypothetical protein
MHTVVASFVRGKFSNSSTRTAIGMDIETCTSFSVCESTSFMDAPTVMAAKPEYKGGAADLNGVRP